MASGGSNHQPPTTDHQSPPATLILGLGNPLRGDDGVGARVVQELQARAFPGDVEVVDGGTLGLGIVPLLEGRRRVIMVDAAEMGEAPGEFARFKLDEARLLGEDQYLSVHSAGPREALLLAQALKMLPQEVIIYGVQPANVEWDSTLSPQVQAALPKLVEAVLAEVIRRKQAWRKS